MFPIDTIVQAALLAFVLIVIILFLVFSMLLAGTMKKRPTENEVDVQSNNQDSNSNSDEMSQPDVETEAQREPDKPKEVPIYEKYPVIYRFEMLYWRGVSKPWWWNNYAKELVEYANEYFPWNRVNYYSSYNSNSKSEDYNWPEFHDRIISLRPHKLSKHPLVVINWDEEYIMVDSHAALEEMKDRIDAEWYRQYGFKKTYRNSPLTYVP